MRKRMPFKMLARLLIQTSDAYCNDGPDYMRFRMIDLIGQLREWCDEVESMLTDPAAFMARLDSEEKEENEMSHFDDESSRQRDEETACL